MSRSNLRVRSGCVVCKKRKIKCDEVKPNCLRCQKAGQRCRYGIPQTWIFEMPSELQAQTVKTATSNTKDALAFAKETTTSTFLTPSSMRSTISRQPSFPAKPRLKGPAHFVRVANFALEHFSLIIAPSLIEVAMLNDGTNGLLTRMVPWTLSDPLLTHALVAEVISHIMVSTEIAQAMNYYRGAALTSLHAKLRGPPDAVAVQAVLCFMLLEGHLGHENLVEAHRKGLRELIKVIGVGNLAMDGFQHYLLQSIIDTPYSRLEHAACDPSAAWSPPSPVSTESSAAGVPRLPELVALGG